MTALHSATAGTSSANHLTPRSPCTWRPRHPDPGERVVCETCGCEYRPNHEIPTPRISEENR